jgi:hypothetical protein
MAPSIATLTANPSPETKSEGTSFACGDHAAPLPVKMYAPGVEPLGAAMIAVEPLIAMANPNEDAVAPSFGVSSIGAGHDAPLGVNA